MPKNIKVYSLTSESGGFKILSYDRWKKYLELELHNERLREAINLIKDEYFKTNQISGRTQRIVEEALSSTPPSDLSKTLGEVRKNLEFVVNRENLTFAEGTDAEEIISKCKDSLELLNKIGGER